MKIKCAFGEYIGDGTAQAGGEDCFNAMLKAGNDVAIVKQEHFVAIIKALKKLSEFDGESIWEDDRDDAARCMIRIAKDALNGEFADEE